MAMMIDTDRVSEIRLSDGKWYQVQIGTFTVDNVYLTNDPDAERCIPVDHRVETEETLGYSAEERGKDTTLMGRLDDIQSYRLVPLAKLPAEVLERRRRILDPNYR